MILFRSITYLRPVALMLLTAVSLLPLHAQQSEECHTNKWEANFLLGLNSDGYDYSISCAWFPIRYAGVRLELGFAGEIEELQDWGREEDDDKYCIRVKLMPSVELRTPTLINWRSMDATIHAFANPGLSFSPGGAGSKGAEWFNWQLRTGLSLQADNLRFSLGYGISDYQLFSGNARSGHDGTNLPCRKWTHSAFLAVGVTF